MWIATVISILFSIFVWEYIAKVNKFKIKPSVFLEWVAKKLKNLFRWIGKWVYYFSSFLTIINWDDFLDTIYDLLKPTILIIFSFVFIFVEYIKRAYKQSRPYLVYFGSFILVAGIVYSWYYGYLKPFYPYVSFIFNKIYNLF